MATRIAYAVILLLNSIISWLMLTPWALKKLEHLTLDYMAITCQGKQCYGFVAVQRVNFALGLFHFALAILLLGVKSSRDGRAALQNGYWGPKIIIWLAFVVMTFFIPEAFFQVWGKYFALAGAMMFVFLGLILLVDLAHTWAEFCLEKIENYDSKAWRGVLIGSTLGMYTMSFAMTIVMYIFFANSGCAMNQAAITVCPCDITDNAAAKKSSGESHRPAYYLRHLGPPGDSRIQPPSWPSAIRHGCRLLHLPYYVRRIHGAR